MSIEVTARDKDIHVSLHEYASKKAANFEAEFPKTSSVHVVLDTERHLYKVQFEATVAGTPFAASAEESDNFIKAIDEAADKLFRQARKHEDKIGDNRKP